MKKIIAVASLVLSMSSFAASISIPNFKVKLETADPRIDMSKISLVVVERCEKISMISADRSGTEVFYNRYSINGNSDNEYEFQAKKLKCSAINGVRIFFDIYTSNGTYLLGTNVQGYGNISVSSEELKARFEEPVIIKLKN